MPPRTILNLVEPNTDANANANPAPNPQVEFVTEEKPADEKAVSICLHLDTLTELLTDTKDENSDAKVRNAALPLCVKYFSEERWVDDEIILKEEARPRTWCTPTHRAPPTRCTAEPVHHVWH